MTSRCRGLGYVSHCEGAWSWNLLPESSLLELSTECEINVHARVGPGQCQLHRGNPALVAPQCSQPLEDFED
jgi:hypothetical protein